MPVSSEQVYGEYTIVTAWLRNDKNLSDGVDWDYLVLEDEESSKKAYESLDDRAIKILYTGDHISDDNKIMSSTKWFKKLKKFHQQFYKYPQTTDSENIITPDYAKVGQAMMTPKVESPIQAPIQSPIQSNIHDENSTDWTSRFQHHAPDKTNRHAEWIDILIEDELDHPDDVSEMSEIDFQSLLEKQKSGFKTKLRILRPLHKWTQHHIQVDHIPEAIIIDKPVDI